MSLVFVVRFDLVAAVKVFDLGITVIQFHIAADICRHSLKLIIGVSSVNIE